MTALIRSEALKVRTTRAPWLLVAGVAALAALGSGLVLYTDNPIAAQALSDPETQRSLLTLAAGNVFALVLGVMVGTADHRHGTATPTYVITPQRLRPFAARAAVTVGAVGVLAAALAAALSAVTIPTVIARGDLAVGVGDVAAVWGRDVLLLAGWGLLGLGIGEVVRSQVGAIVGSLVFLLVASPLVAGLLPDVAHYLPAGLEEIIRGGAAGAPFGAAVAGVLFAAYAAVALVAGAGTLARRDIG
ncbi:MAG TPA: hypothetical protein VIK95_02935 [Egibacteraceae bacterium]